MNIKGTITSVIYETKSSTTLKEVGLGELDINKSPAFFMLNIDGVKVAVSKWVSPKRTRSYPYERVYNTLLASKKITIIPVVKDEGTAGDRDFIQWDTIALMSLLDVYVILIYYIDAEKRITTSGKEKITKQKLDNEFINKELKKIPNYHSSALHWNLKQMKSLSAIVDQAKSNYKKISDKTGVKLKSEKGTDNFLNKINQGVASFMNFSRTRVEEAQKREFVTIQPKEALSTATKAKITIKNYLGGLYCFIVDEVELKDNTFRLIEAKHTASGKIPSKGDVKDGLLKMILYCNLEDVTSDGLVCKTTPVLKLTSSKMKGELTEKSDSKKRNEFYEENTINKGDRKFLNSLFDEAKINSFEVILENG